MKYVDPIDVKQAIKNGQLGVKVVKDFDCDNIILYDILDDGTMGDSVRIGVFIRG